MTVPAGTVSVTPLLMEKLVHSTSVLGGLLTQSVFELIEQTPLVVLSEPSP
jgi:hypothetical protein